MSSDVLVIGAGHAGCEAAAAAARMGATVTLLTPAPETIGAMSCNPAIGGIGKGHLVRELDVFDGLMGRAADLAGIHYRMLNRSKGSAVHGPRVQADRRLYRQAIATLLHGQARLTMCFGRAERLVLHGGAVAGVQLDDGSVLAAGAVVLAAGTFLAGRLFQGERTSAGGRIGEAAADGLAGQLRGLGLAVMRLKTGTPPRIDGRSIDWARVGRQLSDADGWTMSPLSRGRAAAQVACGVTRTNGATHDVIRAGMARSPLRSGVISGGGPRYCPSIEDKVERFGDRGGHQVFLEPEGLDDPLVYPNGLSTSLPAEVQERLVRSIAGLEQARIVVPGYAVEYDCLDPRQLDERLELRGVDRLFCAGQINGTTGYEEAAAQGLVAGLHASAAVLGHEAPRLTRDASYIGVMLDDLTLQGVTEPYRMLTARAEHRLRLRADNAAARLGRLARASGAIGVERAQWLSRHEELLDRAHARLDRQFSGQKAGNAADAIRRGEYGEVDLLADEPSLVDTPGVAAEAVEDARYAPYLLREAADAARLRADEAVSLASIGRYAALPGLSHEMAERLELARPATLGAAGRIRGITPAALTVLLMTVRRAAA